ncbi:hypothetical protein Y032_0026g1440 [Ancylostoma ceylanicum]|uniref:Uncharacterized protein n=1 Tax=Ancylostoma ceylanicum TaxID=53326 RepID=A0A016UUN5_9BILA|nr:hypothetical protein Y032_0026g1440 [Ancylostoma ceylanicum]
MGGAAQLLAATKPMAVLNASTQQLLVHSSNDRRRILVPRSSPRKWIKRQEAALRSANPYYSGQCRNVGERQMCKQIANMDFVACMTWIFFQHHYGACGQKQSGT